ncbi:MAG: photosynthetic complex putative assembly protein PuhB [Pseudomonadota bacterium]
MTHEDDDVQTEPVLGLPERPPEGERILWQGAPAWRGLAWRAFGVRLVALYFGVLVVWRLAEGVATGVPVTELMFGVVVLLLQGLAAAGVLALMAYAAAKATIYTITTKRVAMRIGVALTVTLNLPHRWTGSAALRQFSDGTGDLPLALTGQTRLAYLMLWPHVRPWRLARAEPALRAVPEAGHVAEILARALRDAAEDRARAETPAPQPEPAPAAPTPATPATLVPAE